MSTFKVALSFRIVVLLLVGNSAKPNCHKGLGMVRNGNGKTHEILEKHDIGKIRGDLEVQDLPKNMSYIRSHIPAHNWHHIKAHIRNHINTVFSTRLKFGGQS